jgi:Flp pilus assembly protein TadB
MSKFGVGVGDDFPIDDNNGREQAQPQDDRAEYEEWKRRRDAHRAQREEWRRQREEWRDRKRAFKERVRAAARESFGPRYGEYEDGYYHHSGWRSGHRRGGFPFLVWPALGLLIPILIIALLVSVIAAVFKSPFVFLGLAVLAFLFIAHRHHHHHDHFRGPHGDYDFDLRPAGGPPQPPQPTVVVTPPPSAPSGK